MKYIFSICMLICCALVIVSLSAFAQEGCGGKCDLMSGHGKQWSHEEGQGAIFFYKAKCILKNAAQLGLSEEQTGKIKSLKYSLEKSLIKKDADIKSFGLDIKEALHKEAVDINAVNALIDQEYAVKVQRTKEDIAAYADLKTILTKEQYLKLKEIWAQCRKEKPEHKRMGEERQGHAQGAGMHEGRE